MKFLERIPVTKEKLLKGLAAAVVVLLVLSGYLGYRVYALTRGTKNEAGQVVTDVGKLVELPADETPTVATVSDPSKLKGQPFFADAQVGDKVLLYAHAKRAILYRPSTRKIIGIAPITDAAPTAK